MPHINLVALATVELNGVARELGTGFPSKVAIDGQTFYKEFSLATTAKATLLDVTQQLGDFDFLWVQVDNDAILELVTDDDGSIGERAYTVGLKGTGNSGEYGAPFILARDDSYANYTVDFGGGTLDVITTVRIKNLSSTLTVKGVVFAAT